MSGILIVTNGSSGVEAIRQSIGTECTVLSWDDVLHDGPVPYRDTLEALSMIRAQFLASWSTDFVELNAVEVERRFFERDAAIGRATEYDEIVLWFDHDLYDQLQLLQVGWVLQGLLSDGVMRSKSSVQFQGPEGRDQSKPLVSFVSYGDHLDADDSVLMSAAYQRRTVLSASNLERLDHLWRVFTSETPEPLGKELSGDFAPFGNLQSAMFRLCQEYPCIESRLTRSERQVLTVLSEIDSLRPGALFAACQGMEEAAYLGDWSFWRIVSRLASGSPFLVGIMGGGQFVLPKTTPPGREFLDQKLHITDSGRAVFGRTAVWNRPDFWIGGVRLSDSNDWRWDEVENRFARISRSSSGNVNSQP
jgi:hypothetical protein